MHRIAYSHQFDLKREACIWCGMTRQDIEEYGEAKCPRRELLPLGEYQPLPRYDEER